MGLDMFLDIKLYGKFDMFPLYSLKKKYFDKDMDIKNMTASFGYWRKANAINKWFVDRFGDPEDNGREYEVGIEELIELRELCREVYDKKDEKVSEELLPTGEGFFYGSTDYDNDYYEDIRYTIELIDRAETIYNKSKKFKDYFIVFIYWNNW